MAYTNLSDLFKGICDAIRAKKGTTGTINHQDIPSEIASIETGVDVSGVTASASDVKSGKYYVNSSGALTQGTMTTVTQPTPSISVSSGGVVTSTSTLSNSGYITSGTKSNTYTIPNASIEVVKSSTSGFENFIQVNCSSAGYSKTGTLQYMNPTRLESNLKAENIKSGVQIFNVAGTLSGGDSGWDVPLVSLCNSYYKLTFNRQDNGTKTVRGVMIFCLGSYVHTDGDPETLISYFYNPAGIYGTGTSSMEGATHFMGCLRDANSSGNSRYYREYFKDSDVNDYKPTLAVSSTQIVLSFDSSISDQFEMANGEYYCCIPIFGQGETEVS